LFDTNSASVTFTNQESDLMATSETKVPAKRERSVVERGFVWMGILMLLGIVLVEWRGREGYNATLQDLEDRLQKGILPMAEVSEHVHGLAMRGEETTANRRCITLKWPSLFKQFKLRLQLQGRDEIVSVSAVNGDEDNSQHSGAPSEKIKGLPEGYENIVALTTQLNRNQSMMGELPRELIRQALLIAAQDEMGLATLDPSTGESIPWTDSAHSFPFTLKVMRLSDHGGPAADETRIRIELSRPTIGGKTFEWKKQELTVPPDNKIESLAEQLGKLPPESLADAWKSAGYQKENSLPLDSSVMDNDEHMDSVSQFSQVRRAHGQIRAEGPTAWNLGRLVCAYANLGNLTDCHWGPTSKAFKARSLIYAEQLVNRHGSSPFTLSHRAYALALTGRHATAIAAIDAAKSGKGDAAPDWLPVIAHYCRFETDELEGVEGTWKELAKYLRMRLVDTSFDVDPEQGLKIVQSFLTESPACFRAAETAGEMQSLGIQRMLVSGGYDAIWPDIYQRLASIPDLPMSVRQICDERLKKGPLGLVEDYKTRERLAEELKQISAKERNAVGPSWQVLESLIRDMCFIQAWRTLYIESEMLAVSTSDSLQILMPLYQGHPLAGFVESLIDDQARSRELLSDFVRELDPGRFDVAARPILFRAIALRLNELYELMDHESTYRDDIYEDCMRIPEHRGNKLLVSPNCPRFIAASIQGNIDDSQGIKEMEAGE
jgi:hypothetical protein